MCYARRRGSKGGTSVLAIFFVVLFSVLAISFASMSNLNVQMSRNHRDIVAAQAAAESGLSFMNALVKKYILYGAEKTVQNVVSDDEAADTFFALSDFLYEELAFSGLLGSGSVGDVTTFSEGGQTGIEFTIPAINFFPGDSAYFTLKVRQYDANPLTVRIISEGRKAEIKRAVAILYQIKKDTSILNFSVASKSPIAITDNSTLGLGIYTDWGDPTVAPPITLAGISTIEGDINTVMSPEEIAAAGYTLEEYLSDLNFV